ncbi:MAG: hypothetical protein LBE10_00025 [Treponema sp.]|jgi:hypothetical protein|nr:hypothetical protein [Treponema sp.]
MKSEFEILGDRLSMIIEREAGTLKRIGTIQFFIRQAVENHEWTDFEKYMAEINALSAEFEKLEAEREELLEQTTGNLPINGEKNRFYALISTFSGELRNHLADTYRDLKQEALRIRLFNECFVRYLTEARALTEAFLEAAFPERWGKLYSRQGKAAPSQMQSVLFNEHC